MKKIKELLDRYINKHKAIFLKLFSLHFFTIMTCIVISILCLIPLSSDIEGPKIPNLDKVVHFSMYFFLMFVYLFEMKFFHKDFAKKYLKFYLKGLILCLLLGGIIEILQGLTTYREADILDFIADSLGAISCIVIYYFKDKLSWAIK